MKSSWFLNRTVCLLFAAAGWLPSLLAQSTDKAAYLPDRLIVKVDPVHRDACTDQGVNLEAVQTLVQGKVAAWIRKFPNAKPPSFRSNSQVGVDLTTVYEIVLQPGTQLEQLARSLSNLSEIAYAEPAYISYVDFTPDDPSLGDQWHLPIIRAFDAWDSSTGDASVTVAILDTGTDIDHPDLQPQLQSSVDPVNGIDDDQNGYIDDAAGWDFIDNDNIPEATINDHGIHVAGISSAVVNNTEGIAGVGYGCKYFAVRVGEDRAITRGYDGIVYAADRGADVINCSWGSYTYSEFAQDVVDYATFNQGALVVGAAGNDAREAPYYPAAYDHVLSVGSTDPDDGKSSFSNYGYWLDILAPGNGIYSTSYEGGYVFKSGTSMAAPVLAGAAALVKSRYPQLTPMQLIERLKATAINIDGQPDNLTIPNKLGSGRLDLAAAVTGFITDPAVVVEDMMFTDNNDDAFIAGDTVEIGARFTNYLNASGSLTATLSSLSPHVTIIDDQFSIGTLATLEQNSNYTSPFSLAILPGAPVNEQVALQITITDGTYQTDHFFQVNVNVDYLNLIVNDAITTVTSAGNVGYNVRDTDQGIGFVYQEGASLLYEAGLMVGARVNGTPIVVDNVRNSTSTNDRDFVSIQNVVEVASNFAAQEIVGSFGDAGSATDSLGLEVLQRAWAFSDSGHTDYAVFEYRVVNVQSSTRSDVYIGMLADWDIANFDQNKAETESNRFLAYTASRDNGHPLAGVALLSGSGFHAYSIDNISGGSGGLDIISGFTSEKKYEALSTDRLSAGVTSSQGNDVLQIVSSGPYQLAPGDTATAVFAFLAADHLFLLREAADSAYIRLNGAPPVGIANATTAFPHVSVYPNPARESIRLYGLQDPVQVDVVNLSGSLVWSQWVQPDEEISVQPLPAGMYLLRLQTDRGPLTFKFLKSE